MSDYYNWEKTLAYNADVTMVVGARGLGKTYGLRKQCINDFIKHGWRFVEVARFKNELHGVADSYFNRVGDEFKELEFKTDTRHAYATFDIDKPKKEKTWHKIGYFVALSDNQALKKRTFKDVRRIILDEAILDKTDKYHRYLVNEFVKLAGVVDTVSRERVNEKKVKPSVYLLGNALDILNPYFSAYRVPSKLKKGYSWYANKTFLLHYVDSAKYSKEKLTGTVAGRMLATTKDYNVDVNNEFIQVNDDFVCKKPNTAKYTFGLVCNKHTFGVWSCSQDGFYYITSYIPKNSPGNIYTLTSEDYSINYIMVRKAEPIIKSFSELWYMGCVRYDSVSAKANFYEVLTLFGIK